MADAIVLYTVVEHLNSIGDFASFIGKQCPSVSVIVISFAEAGPDFTDTPSLFYYSLPTPEIPPELESDLIEFYFEIPRLSNPILLETLKTISERFRICAFVIDVFCNAAFDVSNDLGIPTYFCQTSGASSLAVTLYWPVIHENIEGNVADLDDFVLVPGDSQIHSSDLALIMQKRDTKIYKHLMAMVNNLRKSEGIIVFTFNALEIRAVEALQNGLCVPGVRGPAIYPIGPLIGSEKVNGEERHTCLRWLDLQPSKSVVFLCFGRRGVFSGKQLKEIAIGLENSGHRFLWTVRNPPEIDSSAAEEPNLEALLPEGFLERTKDRGVVLKSWAPQRTVLGHESIGGFVSHCGQSSILEAASNGVPIISWPLYAEQRMNRVFVVEEARLAFRLDEEPDGFITAVELEKRVRELTETKTGRELRRRAEEMKHSAAAAMKPGGSSIVALEKFISVVTN